LQEVTRIVFDLSFWGGAWGWSVVCVVWGIAFVGIVLKAVFLPRYDRIGAFLYVLMGWIVCIALKPLIASVNSVGLAWLVAGGLCYTGGVIFYMMRNVKYSQMIWHLFVLAGSGCHIVAVIFGVLADQPSSPVIPEAVLLPN
jgi:hemolysin III